MIRARRAFARAGRSRDPESPTPPARIRRRRRLLRAARQVAAVGGAVRPGHALRLSLAPFREFYGCSPRTRPARRRRRRWPTSPPHGVPCVADCRARCSTSWRGAAFVRRRPRLRDADASMLRVYRYRCGPLWRALRMRIGVGSHVDLGLVTVAPCGSRSGLELRPNGRREYVAVEPQMGRDEVVVFFGSTLTWLRAARSRARRTASCGGRTSHRDFRRPTTAAGGRLGRGAPLHAARAHASPAEAGGPPRRGFGRADAEAGAAARASVRLAGLDWTTSVVVRVFGRAPARRATDRSTARPYTRPRPTAIQCTLRWCRAPRPPGT